ncbi:3-hydroxyacyl-CoA dehydrogenase NAD-binding domain-containing protein [Aureliella helgolandensis]|uniref:Putative 3-hydroxybutyryl-CoA dehydrogenase n=1 Tax=Aureliella helgolandensis TaxID=2527968 RepID=A0A518G5F7_9BACT|nr:3-hydroxyacyl-CoA dehydrogenase NAD-binding domain-containing protein [Aureliella helgolandensis]QDV23799.1 putative 3-hydroxybutyryl-CoA dehydrogenase [Aureliella helgolandensis]
MSLTAKIDHAVIVGAGWVGRQIAARMAQHGLWVTLVDKSQEVCDDAWQWLKTLPAPSENAAGVGVAAPSVTDSTPLPVEPSWMERIAMSCSLAEVFTTPLREAAEGDAADGMELARKIDLVLECVPEQVSIKKRTLRQISKLAGTDTIIASNSSYFVPSMLSAYVTEPRRFAHLHFHVPVLRDSVADIVGCDATDPAVVEALREMVVRIGIEPLLLRREHPGYIFNWLLQSVLKSALELTALDVADPDTIDQSWKAVTGMPLGPFGMMDRIGLDVIEQVLSNARWASPTEVDSAQLLALVQQHTEQGRLGTKTGRGFYDYSEAGQITKLHRPTKLPQDGGVS